MTIKNKGNGNCCCGGCMDKPRAFGADDGFFSHEQYCCSCIPNEICVTSLGLSQGSSRVFARYCSGVGPNATNDDAIYYTGSLPINGLTTTFSFWLKVRNGTCYFCMESTALGVAGDVPDDCFEIDHTVASTDPTCSYGPEFQQVDFCQTFETSFTIDITGHGNSADTSITISVAKSEAISIKDIVKCGACSCICDCACFSVYKREPVATNPSWTYVGGVETVCGDIIYPTGNYCDGTIRQLDPYVLYERLDGWKVTLNGRGQPGIGAVIVNNGTDDSSTCTAGYPGDKTGDGNQYSFGPDGGGLTDIEQDFTSSASEQIRLFTWYGRVHGDGASVDLDFWNTSTSAWDTIKTFTGQATSKTANYFYEYALESKYTSTTGVLLFRYISSDATGIIVDYINATSNDCCVLSLANDSLELYDGFGSTAPVELVFPNDCPEPFGEWDVQDAAGNDWKIVWDCVRCGECIGVPIGGCCDGDPIPRDVTATVDTACPECATFEVILTYDSVSWSATITAHPCFGDISLSWTPCGGIDLSLGACGPELVASSDSMTCDPLEEVYTGTINGIGCCDGVNFGTDFTITITE